MSDSKWAAARIAGVYVFAAALWIFASDLVIATFPAGLASLLQTVKGLLFVLVTGAVLYWLVQRELERQAVGEKQARAVEAMFSQVVDTVPVGVLFVNEDRFITFMNPAAEKLLYLTPEQAVGLRLEELSWSEADGLGAHIGQLLDTGSIDGLRLGRPDDPVPRAVIARAAPLAAGGAQQGWVIAVADVTHAQARSERVERLMSGYRFLSSALVICSRAREPRNLVHTIASMAVESGYQMAWALVRTGHGKRFEQVALVGGGEAASETASRLLEQVNGEYSILSETLTDHEITVGNDIARDPANPWHAAALGDGLGSVVSFGVSGPDGVRVSLSLFSAEAGRFDAEEVDLLRQLQSALSFALEKISLDTHRMAAEHALERSERDYRQLFTSHPSPLWIYDVETFEFLAVNDAAVEKYGYSREEFDHMTVAGIRMPADGEPDHECAEGDSQGFRDAGIWTHRDKRGREFPVHVFCHRIEWDGHPAKVVMVQEVARMR